MLSSRDAGAGVFSIIKNYPQRAACREEVTVEAVAGSAAHRGLGKYSQGAERRPRGSMGLYAVVV